MSNNNSETSQLNSKLLFSFKNEVWLTPINMPSFDASEMYQIQTAVDPRHGTVFNDDRPHTMEGKVLNKVE